MCLVTIGYSVFSHFLLCSHPSEGKRHADALAESGRCVAKKPKLDEDITIDIHAAEDEILDDDVAENIATDSEVAAELMCADTGVAAMAKPTQPEGRVTRKGADIHFKENPYTLLPPNDPVITACM